jgi:hypothetical protein
MKPGATMRPLASITCLASLAAKGVREIATTLPSRIPMSPLKRGARVPSMMVPFWIKVSNWAMVSSPLEGLRWAARRLRSGRRSALMGVSWGPPWDDIAVAGESGTKDCRS